MKRIKLFISAVFFAVSVSLLVFFPEITLLPVGKMLMGTIVTWFGLISYSLFWYYLLPERRNIPFFRHLKTIKDFYLVTAVFWGVISYLLSGNWNFVFQNKPLQFNLWVILTAILLILPIFLSIVLLMSRLFYKET